jgi:Mrp family chromosome partitioning ATPase
VLAGAGKTLRSILVTSAMEGEGKTATALALAKAAAENGRKVLLIDCNMRRPALSSQFGVSAAPGFAGILRGEIEPAAAAVPAALPGSSFIPAGTVRGDPALLLIGGHLPKLMSWAEQYDLVLLDGPAAASGPDAGILAQHAGGVLWCAAWGRSLKSAVKAALDGLAKRRIHPLGFAVTEASPEEMRFYERPRPFGPFCEAPR